MKKLLKKLCSRRGFTLIETLAAIAVMAVFIVAAGAGVSAAVGSYQNMTKSAEASVLLGSSVAAVGDEIRSSLAVDPDAKTYTSAVYGAGAQLLSDDGRLYVQSADGSRFELLAAQTYTSGLQVSLDMTYGVPCAAAFEISDRSGVVLLRQTVDLRSYNE
ncbi:MAG: prepilin-type N-terminal cleavage/methylation domain-containing protein [Oscillospiraceae bacterium]|nr:prepilin-type N-terminal cleavage/methylation domain-containing protein [Oscillospiraceae bacterium]